MEPNHPNNTEDKDFEDIKSKIPFDPDDTKKPEDTKPVDPTPPKKEEEKAPVTPPKEEKTEDEKPEDDKEPKEEDDDLEPPKAKRPEKYIPVAQYVDEKNKWKGTLKEKDDRIAELEKIANKQEGSKVSEDAIKKYAEKHGLDIEDARAEVERVKDILDFSGDKPAPKSAPKEEDEDKTPELSPEQQQRLAEADQIRAEKMYDEEFKTLAVPEINKHYPKATPEQIQAAKAELEKLATTKKYITQDLDYIVFKERAVFDKIFTEPQERKGPEGNKAPAKGKTTFTAQDFNAGKLSFNELDTLTPEERNAIVSKFDTKTWDKYMRHVNRNEELDVS